MSSHRAASTITREGLLKPSFLVLGILQQLRLYSMTPQVPMYLIVYLAANNDWEGLQVAIPQAVSYYSVASQKWLNVSPLELMERALFSAAYHRHHDLVQRLLEQTPQSIDNLNAILLLACQENYLPLASVALQNGATPTDEILLAYAAMNANKEMIKLLVNYGANAWQFGQRGAFDNLEIRSFFSHKLAGLDVEL